jgi:putative methanogenesis marker protein 6
MNETRLIVISPDSEITSRRIVDYIMRRYDVTVKDTCYGALIEGEREKLCEIVEEVRKLDKNGIFSKPRGFPIADPRICRATRMGGPRPGFQQLDMEYRFLPVMRMALDALDRGEEISFAKREEKMAPDEFIAFVKHESANLSPE